MSKMPIPDPGKTKTCFNAIADQLMPLLRQQEQLEAQIEDLKEKARELAKKERGNNNGITTVEIRGVQPNVRVCVNFVSNKTSFNKDTTFIDMKRLQTMTGEEVVTISCNVQLKEGVTLSRVQHELGDKFNEYLEPVYKARFVGAEFDKWRDSLEKSRTASETAQKTLDFVKAITLSQEETPRVSGG
jgi:hypothetical protein